MLPRSATIREEPLQVIVKLADVKSHCVPRCEVSLPYTFDGYRSGDNILVIAMKCAIDYILGMPWLARF